MPVAPKPKPVKPEKKSDKVEVHKAPTGTEVTTINGTPVRWTWTVAKKGVRGDDYEDVEVAPGLHRGHIRSVQEGAKDNPVDDGPLNIIPQTPIVNLSNVKRFENWRVKNAGGQEVIVTLLDNGHMQWEMPGNTPPINVTIDPLAEGRFDEQWWLQGGSWPK
ncbi:MAG TPA: hypothetical protein VII13_05325 [Vicinamibacteria bacterium]|jgi:hypothetical protein